METMEGELSEKLRDVVSAKTGHQKLQCVMRCSDFHLVAKYGTIDETNAQG